MKSKLKKISDARQFNNVLSLQDFSDQGWLWFCVDLVQVALCIRLGHKRPDALVQRALDDKVRDTSPGFRDALPIYRRPFPQ